MPDSRAIRIPIAVMAVGGFIVGMIASFWVAGIFGLPPAAMWSVLVILFLAGVYFLDRPKRFLFVMFLYFAFARDGVLFGYYYIPIPFIRLLDEALLAVPVLIIVMKAVQRQLPRVGSVFPVVYLALAALSFYINRPPVFNMIRVVLAYGKFFIFWYFARAIGPWSASEKRRWFWLLVAYILLQVPVNFIWHGHIVLRYHPDVSVGTIGSAHIVGYMSAMGLFMIAGWMIARKPRGRPLQMGVMIVVALLIAYNLVFLTDTKHVLFFIPLAGLPFLFFPKFNLKARLGVLAAGIVLGLATWTYFKVSQYASTDYHVKDYLRAAELSGKGSVFRTITRHLRHEVPLAGLLGAGPGNFCSTVALYSFRPLSNKYILPYVIMSMRSGGQVAESSVVGSAMSSLYTVWGEFGPIVLLVYFWFWFFSLRHLWRQALRPGSISFEDGQRLAVISGVITIFLVGLLIEVWNIGILMLPLWTLAGIYWEEEPRESARAASPAPVEPPAPRRRII